MTTTLRVVLNKVCLFRGCGATVDPGGTMCRRCAAIFLGQIEDREEKQ